MRTAASIMPGRTYGDPAYGGNRSADITVYAVAHEINWQDDLPTPGDVIVWQDEDHLNSGGELNSGYVFDRDEPVIERRMPRESPTVRLARHRNSPDGLDGVRNLLF